MQKSPTSSFPRGRRSKTGMGSSTTAGGMESAFKCSCNMNVGSLPCLRQVRKQTSLLKFSFRFGRMTGNCGDVEELNAEWNMVRFKSTHLAARTRHLNLVTLDHFGPQNPSFSLLSI